ncbi:unnamed protein product [Phytophthora lilii]|uniref:Unnamed protein product n=1 Tax=Phytophthora lilii TaxID=2077276 RepID=A0A9W6TTZ4_9STRA|nr:unnamed protein product [Phytophthora lilii]
MEFAVEEVVDGTPLAELMDERRISCRTQDLYSTCQLPGGWARLDENECIENFDELQSVDPLDCSRLVGDYFPADIPSWNSGIVAVVSLKPLISYTPRSTVTSLRDDKPRTPNEGAEEALERSMRVQRALGLFVVWDINGTDFSQQHAHQGAQWLLHQRCPGGRCAYVFIGDKPTWRDLYIACNEAEYMLEGKVGSRFIQGIELLEDGTTFEISMGT